MGIYLSTPETTKNSEYGTNDRLQYGLSSMQGWRRTMEDSHIAQLDFTSTLNRNASIFGVFDGHGGCEVAHFCRNHMVQELLNLEAFQQGNYELALKQLFHRMDEMLQDEANFAEIESYKQLAFPPKKESTGGEQTTRRESMNILEQFRILTGAIPSQENPTIESKQSPVPVTNKSEEEEEERNKDEVQTFPEPAINKSEVLNVSLDNPDNATNDDKEAQEDKSKEILQSDSKERSVDDREKILKDSNDQEKKVNISGPELKTNQPTTTPNSLVLYRGPGSDDELKQVFSEGDSRFCTLPDHRIQAGCTSIVALLCGEQLYVANAGDSRGVLCRNGQAIPMSFDHKPTSKIEYTRIREAGGFVNSVGRVNGNLNLSRAIGDLKYKQVENVSVEQQIITAEPDIEKFLITDDDEFFVLACDGVWDCMTNEQIVEFIKQRINTKSVHEIVEEILDRCLADDVRRITGIGTDNMTCIIVKFNKLKQLR